jgi:hypothetical protein
MGTKYGTVRQIEAKEKELAQLEALEADSYRFGQIREKETFRIRKNLIKRNLEAITPPPVKNDAERLKLEARATLLENFLKGEYNGPDLKKPAPLSRADRWERPTGATGVFLANERARKHYTVLANGDVVKAAGGYGAAFELKDIRRRLASRDEQVENPDIGNVDFQSESFSGRHLMDRRSMSFAQGANVSEAHYDKAVGRKRDGIKRPLPLSMRCTKTRKDGSPCAGKRVGNKDYCLAHKPKEPPAQQAGQL